VPLEIVWSPLARARLREIRAYVARDQQQAAERLAIRIVAVVEALRDHPYMGRVGAEPGIRELVIGGHSIYRPVIVLYRVRGQLVIVNTIWHGAQSRQAQNLRRD
jgi:plasmid stabilization system protein ParE